MRRIAVVALIVSSGALLSCGARDPITVNNQTTTPDNTPPTISTRSPAPMEQMVALDANVVVTFSESMDAGTFTSTTFKLRKAATPLPGAISVMGNAATLDPNAQLDFSTTYSVDVTTGVTDVAGNALGSTATWSFTTRPAVDNTNPTIVSTDPKNGDEEIVIKTAPVVNFSEPMAPSSLTGNVRLLLSASGDDVKGTASLDVGGTKLTFTPDGDLLEFRTKYTLEIGAVTDLAGNVLLATPKRYDFQTEAVVIGQTYTINNQINFDTKVFLDTDASFRVFVAASSGTATQRWTFLAKQPSGVGSGYVYTVINDGIEATRALTGGTAAGVGTAMVTNAQAPAQRWELTFYQDFNNGFEGFRITTPLVAGPLLYLTGPTVELERTGAAARDQTWTLRRSP